MTGERRRWGTAAAGVVLALLGSGTPASAWDGREHALLAARSLALVRSECPAGAGGDSVDAALFAQRSAHSARDDLSPARHHVRAQTPLEQLRALTSDRLQAALDEATRADHDLVGRGPVARNVVANYLAFHLIALSLASRDEVPFARALAAEAVALGYLGDSFSSAHMFIPVHLKLTSWQGVNVRAAHHFFAGEGAYVLNARGEVWQSFGDGMLEWYLPTYERVFEACVESLREVHLVRAVRRGGLVPGDSFRAWADRVAEPHDWETAVSTWLRIEPGEYYYEAARLPALLRIPMPVAASWSVRTAERDESGLERRHHYPQLREPGGHDPNGSALDRRFLFPREAVPEWLVSDRLEGVDPAAVIRDDPGVASAHYIQTRDFAPSVAGVILRGGGGVLFGDKGGGVLSVAAGYGWETPLLLGSARAALELEYYLRLGDLDRRALAPYFVLGLALPLRRFDSAHLKLGYAWGLESPYDGDGYAWGLGVATPALQFPFTYAGVSLRLGYQQFRLEDALDGLQVQLVLQ